MTEIRKRELQSNLNHITELLDDSSCLLHVGWRRPTSDTTVMHALIDRADAWRVTDCRWTLSWSGHHVYVTAVTPGSSTVLLHRFLISPSLDAKIGHINGNALDCRRVNLRVLTQSEVCWSAPGHRNKTSRFKGVHRSRRGRWIAQINPSGVACRHLGTFDSEYDAACAYDRAAIDVWGEDTYLNFGGDL